MIETLKKSRWLFYLEGILLMGLGTMAIILPQVTTISIAILAGVFLVIAGIVMFFRAFRLKEGKVFWLSLLSGLLATTIGILMFRNLAAGIFGLTFLLIAFLSAEGVLKIAMANALRPFRNWGYLLFNGIVTLMLVFIIIAGLPQTAFWALGLIFGVYLLVSGFSMIAFAIGLEKIPQQAAP